MNNYVSLNENKRLLGISTMDMGYYLLDIKNSFQGCSRIVDIDEDTDFLIAEQSGYSVDAVFRDDGTYLYVAHKGNGISGYKTDILERDVIKNSSTTFSLKDGQSAYNLKLYNNNNELFVTTDKGVLIYDVGSSRDELSYVSEYLSEGAQKDYYPAIDSFEDYIFITDGYKGVKVLKLNNSFHPMLCGVEYFAPNNNDYELSKTTSVKYDKGYLYVGVTSQGIAKLKLEDLLFEHCK
jgi:ligand-binding sensor domain-containing protein